MVPMKRKQTIRLKDPRLRKARTELRTLLHLVWQEYRRALSDQIDAIYNDKSLDYESRTKKVGQIIDEIKTLDFTYNHSCIRCRVCGHQDLDLTYNPKDSTWYCESCYRANQEYYKENPHPYKPDWRDLYP